VAAGVILGADGYPPPLVAALATATSAAAVAAREWYGRGDKHAADEAAVAAMRAALRDAPFDGTVVIGEGEKDAAPMLANGERLGDGSGPAYDVAVDPLDGTRLVAEGTPGSICVLALAPRGAMLDPGREFYMHKAVSRVAVDLALPPAELVAALHAALGRVPRVTVLDKPRHVSLVATLRDAGAVVTLVGEGDIAAGVAAATPGSGVDLAIGVGGTPEGVITACAVRALGASMVGRIADRAVTAHDLVRSPRTLYVAAEV
jgi:fructose-1,6-bisphosphatase II